MAEGVGFEPTVVLPTPVFKTGTLNRSDTPPGFVRKSQNISLVEKAKVLNLSTLTMSGGEGGIRRQAVVTDAALVRSILAN